MGHPTIAQEIPVGARGTVFGVPGAEDDSRYARHGGCTCAHRARLEGHDQRASGQSPFANDSGGLAERQYLRVRCRITGRLALIARACDYFALRVEDDRADGQIGRDAWRSGARGFIECDAHRSDISG
jgi:hypothetical protein